MIRKTIAALAMAVLAVGLISGPATPAHAATCIAQPVIAHRGGDEHFAENTRNAFRDATNLGVKSWETDVRFTADDIPVIMHDPDVDRTTDGTGDVSAHTYAELAAMRTSDDQTVPTLRDFINDAAVDQARLFIEVKTLPTAAQWTAFNAAIASRPVAAKVILMSFDKPTLTAAATYAPTLARALVQDVGDVDPATVTPYANILIKHHNAITSGRMTNWTTGGLTVYAWTVDTTAEMLRMTWYSKLAGVITDSPAGYLAWQKSGTC